MSLNEERFLIDESIYLKRGQKLTALGITLFFWGAFLYLCQPLISLIAWWLNVNLFYNHMILLGGYHAFLDVVKFYLLVIAVLGGGLIFWARINLWRFRNKNHRKSSAHVNEKGIHEYFAINKEMHSILRSASCMKVTLNQNGGIEKISK